MSKTEVSEAGLGRSPQSSQIEGEAGHPSPYPSPRKGEGKIESRPPYGWLSMLIIFMTVIALAIGAIALHYVETILIASTGETLALAAADIADKLDLLLSERYRDIRIMSYAAAFRERDPDAAISYLEKRKQITPSYRWLGVTDAAGRIIAATAPASIGKDASQSEWFRAARDTGTIHVRDAEVSEETNGVMAVAFSAPILSSQGKFLGVVTSRVELPALKDIFARTVREFQFQQNSRGKLEYEFLTHNGEVITDSFGTPATRLNLKTLGVPSSLLIASAHPGFTEEQHYRRKVPVVTGYAQTEGYLRWGVMVRMDRSEILTPIHLVLVKMGFFGALVVVPLIGLLLVTTGRLRAEWVQAREEWARASMAEAALRLRDRAISATRNGIFITDPTQPGSPIVFINAAFERLTGYAAKDILGYNYRFLQGPDTDPAAFVKIRDALREERECRVVLKHRRKDGTTVWNDVEIAPIRDSAGRVTHFVGVLTDITERKRAEERLAKINECLLSFGADAAENINRLTAVCGELMGATCALYNRLDQGRLHPVAQWRIPPGYESGSQADRRFGFDVIRHAREGLHVLRSISHTGKAGAGPSVRQHQWETYIGKAVRSGGSPTGSLCLMYQKDYVPNEADEKLMGIIASAIGVEEERKAADEALRESEERYRVLFESNPHPTFLFDMETLAFLAVNEAAIRHYGYSREEFLEMSLRDIRPPEDMPPLVQRISSLSSGIIFAGVWRHLRKDGSIIFVELTSTEIFVGERRARIAVASDITERKETEEKLKLYRQIFAKSNDGISVIDPQGCYIEQNAAHHELLGYFTEELEGKTPALHLGEEAYAKIVRELARTGKYRGECISRKKSGETIHLDLSAFSVLNEHGKVLCHISINRDITERKQAAEIQTRLLERVISAQEEERARISRELHDETGQSLTALLVGLRVVECAKTLEEVQSWSQSLRAIAALTLEEVGRLASGLRPAMLDDLGLMAALERYTTEYAEAYGIEVKVQTTGLEANRLPLKVETALYRIMQEALTNVAKHASAQKVDISVERESTFVEMTVKDNGQGFDVNQVLRTQGTSRRLGLHGMRERAAVLSGAIRLKSAPLEGTTVSVRIPVEEETHGENSSPHRG